MKGDRGQDKGGYVLVWTFDCLQTRDFYFPKEGEGPSDEGGKLLSKILDVDLAKYFQDTGTEDTYTDYVVIGQGFTIDGSGVIAFRPLDLKQGVNARAFEEYAENTFTPTMLRNGPGMKGLVMKVERGEHKGRYVYVLTFDSVQTRNFYFPEEGGGLSAAANKLMADVPDLSLEEYLQDPNTTIDYTDYVLIE